MAKKQWKKGKVILDEIIEAYGWRLTPFSNPSGIDMFYLTKMYKGQFKGHVAVTMRQLKNLKRFMKERHIK